MDISRREFLKAVVVGAALPGVGASNPASAWTVNRRNMWPHDLTSAKTLTRCDKILAIDSDNVLARVHRGSVPEIYTDKTRAWDDLSRAVTLEQGNPCVHYVRGVAFDNAPDLQDAISLLSMGGVTGKAICSSTPDIYSWDGDDRSELYFLAHRELGSVFESAGRYDEALAAFEVVASYQIISQPHLERWTQGSPKVGRFAEGLLGYRTLIEMEPKADYIKGLEECERWMRVPRKEWWAMCNAERHASGTLRGLVVT